MNTNVATQNINTHDTLIEESQVLKDEISRLNNELESANKKLDDFNNRSEALQRKEKDLQELKSKLLEKETELNLKEQLNKVKDDKLNELRQKKLSELAEWERAERTAIQDKIDLEYNKSLKKFNDEFAEKVNKLNEDRQQLDKDKQELEAQKRGLDCREELLNDRENLIEQEIKKRLESERENFKNRLAELNQSNERLRESIRNLEKERNSFADLESRLNGQNPLAVLSEIEVQKTLIFQLQEELKERPSKEVQDTLAILQNEKQSLLHANQQLREENSHTRSLQKENEELECQKEALEIEKAASEGHLAFAKAQINELRDKITLLSKPFDAEQNRQQRIDSLLMPPQIQLMHNITPYENIAEQTWLSNIYQHCQDSGFEFPKRILNAFHTSLKTSEFSPITVLAGVSGTGKSQLPALYSKFGGINFINVPVQPNWDSQEAMLGYFNSMTNHFDAQPVLRFLMQTQQDRITEYPYGLKDMMSLILLDEMNLSHPELYFAEFLSKLEERRAKEKNEVPNININLGSGIEGYNLPLNRNVLWVGTMNQDETTKSLSDKVIDRSFIINFPRPKILKSLSLRDVVNESRNAGHYYLTYEQWRSWIKIKPSFNVGDVKIYKNIIEQINDYMDKAGRALGHRVWQSVEYYMSNHPDVIVAHSNDDEDALKNSMKIAFEDQLVQKVMPKLRGIETRGRTSKNCLEPIQNLLDDGGFAIVEDFKHAREVGHGQFIWNSAYYLEAETDSEE